ncbi:hypothetical protein Mapa_007018 [Marchantia paleacea]|nr:hypothetical protein Mapa_007018 [Marchantia paleacea]
MSGMGEMTGAEVDESDRMEAAAAAGRDGGVVEKSGALSAAAVAEVAEVDGKGKKKTKKKKKKEDEAESPPQVSFFRLFAFADGLDLILMFFGTLGAAVHGAALPVFFLFFGKLLNGIGGSINPEIGKDTVDKYSLYFLWLGLATLFSSWLEVSFWMQTGERQSARLRAKYLEALLRQDVGFFDTDTSTGKFVQSISSDPLMVQDAISEKMGNFIHYMSTFVAGFIVGFVNQWRIALVTLAVVPLIAVAGGYYAYALTGLTSRSAEAYERAGSLAEETISQVRTVYSFVGEQKSVQHYSLSLESTLKLGYKSGSAKGIGMGGTYGTLFGCWALLLWYGGTLVRDGTVNGGQALSSIFAVIIGGLSLGQAMPNMSAFGKGRAAAYKIFQMVDHEPTINRTDPTAKKLDSVQGLIELRNVEFVYPSRPDTKIFQDFSLVIPPGKTVAIVGSSGSGKSTVVSLIERFYDPLRGQVLLDGHDIKILDLKWLRGQIGLVNQEPALFATTIAANILYGKEGASEKEIEEAAKAANAHSFVDQLPQRYMTQVGERGVQLSGGQKQRVAIARAMLKNPTVLLLDEATSALDAGSEQIVQEALDRLMVGRTTVVVAHRLSTIRNADSIAVVQEGRIVERGNHETLIADPNGAYTALVRLQEMAATKGDAGSGSMKRAISGRQSQLLSRSGSRSGSRGASRGHSLGGGGSFSLFRSGSVRSTTSVEESDVGGRDIDLPPLPPPQGALKRLIAMSKHDWIYGVFGAIGSICAGGINPAFALIVSQVLNAYYNKDFEVMKKEVSKWALVFVGIGLATPVVYLCQHYSLGVLGENLVKTVRVRMFGAILRNEMAWFDQDENNSSRVAARLSSDATQVRGALGDRLAVILQNAALMAIAVIISFVLQWKLTLVMLSVFPALVGSAFGENLFLKGFAGDVAKAYSSATQVAGEAVANIRTVAAFNAEVKVRALFDQELVGPNTRSFYRGQVAGFGFGISQLFMFGSYGLGLWYSGRLVQRGEAQFGDVMKVFLVLIVSAFAVAETLALTPDLVKGSQAVASVFEVLDRKTAIDPEDPTGERVEKMIGEIELKHVAFAYPSRPDVIIFKDLNLRVRSGHSLALVGSSGSGKSSVIALLERFYDPLSGRVMVDGKDIRKYNLKSLRQHIALVQQEPALFATTIYENIVYGRAGATEAEVIEAAKAANAHNYISGLPMGYQTEVGERGVQLSGGQKQRVAIARAVLKDPAILLLDEATSALDAESEKIVQEALDRLMKNRTTVMVAHRLSTIRNAHSIAVIQEGTIVEQGTHTELLAKNGGYSRLINLQNNNHENHESARSIS